MAKVCYSCGKRPAFGNSRSHSMVATRRRFNPNLQKVRVDDGGRPRRVYVCTRCLKSGKVVKAEALCGHPILAKAATDAALQAHFTPTLLSGMPVKVSGVITYSFVLQ